MSNRGSKKGHAKGYGYIYKRGTIYWLQYDVNGKRKRVSLGEKEIRKAEAKAKDLMKPVREAITKENIAIHVGEARKLLKSGKTFIAEAWNLFLKSPRRPDSSEGTLGNYKRNWQRFVEWLEVSFPSVLQLSHISDDIANEYFENLWATGISANTFNYHRQSVKLVFNTVRTRAGIDVDPFDGITKKIENKQSRKEFSQSEVISILDMFRSPNLNILYKKEMEVMFHIGAWTGLRLVDCALMGWESLDMTAKKVVCVPHKTARKGQVTVTIPMHPTLYSVLQEATQWKTDEYVLPNIAKRYGSNPHGVRQDTLRVLQEAGLETTQKVSGKGQRKQKSNIYGFHSFRHSFVSFCANAGVPLPVVQSIVGHGNPAITRHYIHIGEDAVKQAVASLPGGECKKDQLPEDRLKKVLDILNKKKKLSASDEEILKALTV